MHGRTTQQRTEPVSLDAIKLVRSECNVAVINVPILRNTLFWKDSPYFGGTVLILK